jgi:hypothetical protein
LNKNENKVSAKTIIEINGRKYDALTGRIITDEATLGAAKSGHGIHSAPSSGVIDGFQKPRRKLQSSVVALAPISKKPQKAQTLARNIVKKPALAQKPKPVSQVAAPKRELSVAETRRRILSKTPAERLERAESTKQSSSVTRFSSTNNVPKPTITPHIAVAREHVAEAAPIPSAPPLTTTVNTNTHPTKKQVFTHPLAGANAHLALPPKKQRFHQRVADTLSVSPKFVSITAACLAVIVLSGFFAYQRIPNISMKVAASRAGFSGTIPGDTPAGYAFTGPIKYENNAIVVSYKSNSDNRKFNIVQRPSDWSSEALLSNFVNGSNMHFQTYNDHGLTVYVMEKNNASWVNNGIWYTLNGTDTLSTEQVLAMAASM